MNKKTQSISKLFWGKLIPKTLIKDCITIDCLIVFAKQDNIVYNDHKCSKKKKLFAIIGLLIERYLNSQPQKRHHAQLLPSSGSSQRKNTQQIYDVALP